METQFPANHPGQSLQRDFFEMRGRNLIFLEANFCEVVAIDKYVEAGRWWQR